MTARSQTPLVTVIVPCFRQAAFLPAAIGSILAQTVTDWECLIINDASPDDTREVARRFTGDRRIRYLEHANRGVSYTRNRGLSEARGRYIQFLDADDFIAASKFELQLNVLAPKSGLSLSYCDYCYCSQAGELLPNHNWYRSPCLTQGKALEDLAIRWEKDLSIAIHSFLFDAKIFREHGVRFDENLPANEDWDCWMQVFSLKPSIKYVNEKMAFYRIHDTARTRDGRLLRDGFLKALRKQQAIFAGDTEMSALLARKIRMTKHAYRAFSPWRRFLRGIYSPPRRWLKTLLVRAGWTKSRHIA